MGNFNQNNQILIQINNYNQNNPMLNQINNYNQNNQMLIQTNNYNQINPMLNQICNYSHNNQIFNQMNNYNQNNQILYQMNNHNENNQMINQMNAYGQNNQMLNNQKNQMMEQMMMNQNINQMNEINPEKRIKDPLQNFNLNNFNKNQMELINSIIQFYKENGNEYMNFDYPNQIKNISNLLSLNYHKLDKSDNIENPLYYIEDPKVIIRFMNSDYKEFKVNIPLSITNYDLYSIAQNYKCFKNNKKHLSGNHSNILLIYNNLILNRDETSISYINNNDIIFIIEPRNFPDDSYYNSLQERTKEKGIISFRFTSGNKIISRAFPDDIKIYEIYKSINLEFGLDINTYNLLFNGSQLKINDDRDGSIMFGCKIFILEESHSFCTRFGKVVIATIIINKQNENISIGILNSVKDLRTRTQNKNLLKKLKKLIIGNKVIEKDDTMSLFSLGIKNDFTFSAEF